MRILKERTEIASTINFHKMPAVPFDMANVTEYGLKGGELLVDMGKFPSGEPWYEHGELYVYRDKKNLVVSGDGGCGIHADFGYSDIKEMIDRRNLPIIQANQEILIVPYDSKTHEAWAPMVIKTGSTIKHCTEPISLEVVDMSMWLTRAGFKEVEYPEPDWEYTNN